MAKDRRAEERKRQRETIDDAREEGVGEPAEGLDPTVPSYTDPGGVSDFGVDEPVVPRDDQGKPPEAEPEPPSDS